MYTIEVERHDLNHALLDQELRALAGEAYIGISTRPGVVAAHLTEVAASDVSDAVRQAIRQHDATQLTEAQAQAIADQAALEVARSANGVPVNPDDYSQNALLQQLARKVAWLEREMRDLRRN
jgi:hypothetical protein